MKDLTLREIVDYECATHWLAPWLPFDWMQDIAVAYLVRRAKRKHNRYKKFIENCVKYL